MEKIKNLSLSGRLKKIFAALTAAGITLASTGCGIEGKNDDVANNHLEFIDEQTLPSNETTLSSASTSVETTTTLKPFDKNSGRIKHFDDGTSVVSDYVETSYESDLAMSDTTSTTAKTTDIIADTNKNDNTTKTSKSTTAKPVTTTVKITTKPATKTSVDTTKATTKPTTAKTTEKTTKPTTKTTTITTKATTPKPTTTVTTTTTEAVTEPVVQGGDRLCINGYYIEDIGNDYVAYMYFQENLYNELTWKYNCPGILEVDVGYGNTTLGRELSFLIYSCNYKHIYGDSLNFAYFDFNSDTINNSKYFLCNAERIQEFFETKIDLSQYCIDENDRIFLHNASKAYREGWFDSFINDNINNIPDNAGVYAILYSFDCGTHLSYDDVNNKLDDMITNYVPEDILGFSYTK